MKAHYCYITHKKGEPAVISEPVQPEVLTIDSQQKRDISLTK